MERAWLSGPAGASQPATWLALHKAKLLAIYCDSKGVIPSKRGDAQMHIPLSGVCRFNGKVQAQGLLQGTQEAALYQIRPLVPLPHDQNCPLGPAVAL